MRQMVRTLGHYFGLVDGREGADPDGRVPGADALELHLVRDSLLRSAVAMSFLAVAGALAVYGVFDWTADEIAFGTAVGIVLWGAASLFENRSLIPRMALRRPPDGAVLSREPTRSWRQTVQALAFLAPALLAFAWLADRVDLGAALVPGQFAGTMAGRVLTAVLVARWERRHDQRVVAALDGASRHELFSIPAAAGRAPARPVASR